MSFLTETDLEYMTGLKQPAAQIRYLQKWKVKHFVSVSGHPRVTWAAVEGIERDKPKTEPNFAAIKRAG